MTKINSFSLTKF